MSTEEVQTAIRFQQEQGWFVFGGDFALLKEFLSRKRTNLWIPLQFLDYLLRGFGALIGEPSEKIENGLTVFNPLLVGALAYVFIPKLYGPFDAFCLLFLFFCTIFSVYLSRSIGIGKLPSLTYPFVIAEFMLLFILKHHNSGFKLEEFSFNGTINNGAGNMTIEDTGTIVGKEDTVSPEWGMIFRGVVTSASQVFAVDDVAVGSVVYLAILIYSPITTVFSLAGALISSLLGLQLNVPVELIYSGVWGFNGILTGAALGGHFLIINQYSCMATIVAIAFTSTLQFIIYNILDQFQLPFLAMPFVLTTWLFLCLANSTEDTFIYCQHPSYPEKQRQEFYQSRVNQRERVIDEEYDPEALLNDGKTITIVS
ncbi:urea transporter 1-like isoform X2 [Leptopilina heterotoma]|uniref:urea transporter 1-like isoform X2 n=1 Tax=Leptopilina heterotoma TaxID=63436 RepID=UPI001CAA1425|nr:urea transporter 1-like isoform X2 [Leptopilina heterotoma]